jgi:transposase
VPSCLLEPIWVEFHALLNEARGGEPPTFDPGHPWGCHRRRIPDRVVFEHVIDALVHGSGYERIATRACSDRTIRRRLKQWARLGLAERLHAVALAAYDLIIGLELADLSIDECITKTPCGGDKAGPSPVDRRKGGLKRSVCVEGYGIPLAVISAGANRHDSPLLTPTLQAAQDPVTTLPEDVRTHLDSGYDSNVTRWLLDELGFSGEIARKGMPSPIQVGKRWVVERTNLWMNGYGKLCRMTDRTARSSTSTFTSTSPQRSSPYVSSSNEHAPATAGTPAPPPDAPSDPYCRSLLMNLFHPDLPADQVTGLAPRRTGGLSPVMREAAARLHRQTGRSAGNGSLMRTAVVALPYLDDPAAMTEAVRLVSGLTHFDDLAGDACVLWCSGVRRAVLDGTYDGVRDGLALLPRERRDQWAGRLDEAAPPRRFSPNGFVVPALQAAWSAVTHTATLPDGLAAAVRAGDDTDTVAAIAGALLGARHGASAVPPEWREKVHGWPGLTGDDLVRLAERTADPSR